MDPGGRRDFIRSAPIHVMFTPSFDPQDQKFSIPIVQDNINEATEGFLAVIEAVDSIHEVTLIREGVALVSIRDDDSKTCSCSAYNVNF